MGFTMVSPIRNMTFENYLKQPKQLCEIVSNKIFDENTHLLNAPGRSSNHPLIRNYSHTPK